MPVSPVGIAGDRWNSRTSDAAGSVADILLGVFKLDIERKKERDNSPLGWLPSRWDRTERDSTAGPNSRA
jgi:hypothetical protein